MVTFRNPPSTWCRVPPLVLPASAPTFCCAAAGHLATYATQLFERLKRLSEQPTAAQVEQAEAGCREACFLLQQRWFEIRRASPAAHQDKLQTKDGALCVYGVYLATLARFVDYRNQIAPPPLGVRAKPTPAPAQVDGLGLVRRALGILPEE